MTVNDIEKIISHSTLNEKEVWNGPAFNVIHRELTVDDRKVGRDIVHHAPVVYILAHDVSSDTYLLEREYRAGADAVCYGLPAGFIDNNEEPSRAAVREVREETGLVVNESDLEPLFNKGLMSSQGFTDEVAWCWRVDVPSQITTSTDFDGDEVIRSGWVPFRTLSRLVESGGINGSVAVAMILNEKIRRVGAWSVEDKACESEIGIE